MWHSTHSDLLLVRVSSRVSCSRISIWESRRAPRLAVSLSRVANTAKTRYSSDIVVNVRTIAALPSCWNACLNELNKLVKLSETRRSWLSLLPLSRTSPANSRSRQALPGAWWQYADVFYLSTDTYVYADVFYCSVRVSTSHEQQLAQNSFYDQHWWISARWVSKKCGTP